MDPISEFRLFREKNVKAMSEDGEMTALASRFFEKSMTYKYSYNFDWMGRPIIQYPQDIIAMQEIMWRVKPDLVIETGVAHGGSIIFYASMMEMMDIDGGVIGIDVEIRKHNRDAIEKHPMYKRIDLVEGSSVDSDTLEKVRSLASGRKKALVCLDSLHTHDHVLKELEMYSPFVKKGSYLVVFDTVIEDMPKCAFSDRPWDVGNNPKTAVAEFLKKNTRFEVEKDIEKKLLLTVAPGGYLKCVKDP